MTTTQHASGRSGLVMVTLAALTWGTIGVAVSMLYKVAETDPFSVSFLRLMIAGPALLLLSALFVGPDFWRVRRAHLPAMGLIGVAFAGYQLCYFAAIPRLGVAAAVMINICSAPVFTTILAGIFLRERLTWVALLALGGAIAGTVLLVGGAPQAASTADLLSGAGLALGAGFCYSLVVLGGRVVAPYYHPIQPIALSFSLGAILLLGPALAHGLVIDYPPLGWFLLIYLSLVPTALAYVLYLRGLRSTPATVAAIISLLEPLGSTTLAVLFLGERLGGLAVAGAALLLVSLATLYLGQTATPAVARAAAE